MEKEIFILLQSLISAFGPCGQEDEVRYFCEKELRAITDKVWIDPAGNLIGKIDGQDPSADPVRIMVHMDELSLIVKRVNEDGSLRVNPLGAMVPSFFGQGGVDIIGDKETFSGVLSFGCMHTTRESANINKILPEEYRGQGKSPIWDDVVITTRKSQDELKTAGVHPGTRVVIARSQRQLFLFQDCVAGYFMDNRAAVAVALSALKKIKIEDGKPKRDIYFVATTSEEVGAHGASYACRTLPGNITLAIDVGPVAKEYQTVLSADPIVVYQDGVATYDKKIADQLVALGEGIGLKVQSAIFGTYASDSSLSKSRGQLAQAALLCVPVENTHGYEIIHQDSLTKCAELLAIYLIQ